MPGVWKLEEARLVQNRTYTSAANALNIGTDAPGPGKCWVLLGVGYKPSVAETKVISFQKIWSGVSVYSMLNPVSMNLNPALATPIEQGMEYLLLPHESIQATRDSATAGSTMNLVLQFVEIDLPLYTYDEPQIVKRQRQALSTIRTQLGGGTGRGGMVGGTSTIGGPGGRGGGPAPM